MAVSNLYIIIGKRIFKEKGNVVRFEKKKKKKKKRVTKIKIKNNLYKLNFIYFVSRTEEMKRSR